MKRYYFGLPKGELMKFILLTLFLCACMPKSEDEMELLGKDVLKSKRGLIFDIEPGDAEEK